MMTTTVSDDQVWQRIRSVPHWYHQVPIRPGIVTPGGNDCAATLRLLDLPADLHGKRVLDLGTRDGFFAFEAERRGAEVMAIDYLPADRTGFAVCAELLGSRVTFLNANIYNLTADRMGTFDVVFFLGLIYHLPDPLLALNLVRQLCRDRLFVESHVIDNAVLLPDGASAPLPDALRRVPLMEFYPGRALNDDPTNFWGPNLACLAAMLQECNFAVTDSHLVGNRGILNCRAKSDREIDHLNRIARGVEMPT